MAAPSKQLDLKKAQTYIDLGTELFGANDYAGALAEFQRAEPLAPSGKGRAAVRYNIARCLEELGRTEEAVTAFELYLEAPDDAGTARAARRKVRSLERKLFGGLTVRCAGSASVGDLEPQDCPATWTRLRAGDYEVSVRAAGFEGRRPVSVAAGKTQTLEVDLPGGVAVTASVAARVRVDGREVGTTPIDRAVLPPGAYEIEVQAPEHAVWQQRIEVRPGELTAVEAHLVSLGGFPDVAEPYLRWGTAGASAAALVGGVVALGIAAGEAGDLDSLLGAYDDADTSEEAGRLRADAERVEGEARAHRALGYTLVGVGALLAGAATWLFLRDAPDDGAASTSTQGF